MEYHTVIDDISSDTAWFMPGAIHPDGSYWMPSTNPAFFNFDTWGEMWHITSDGFAEEADSWEGDYSRSTLFKASSKGQSMTACGMIRDDNNLTFPAIWIDGFVLIEERMKTTEIYPNPASTIIRISVPERVLSYEIMNLGGEIILSGNGQTIEISELASGIYIARYHTSSGVGVTKFVKVNP